MGGVRARQPEVHGQRWGLEKSLRGKSRGGYNNLNVCAHTHTLSGPQCSGKGTNGPLMLTWDSKMKQTVASNTGVRRSSIDPEVGNLLELITI